MQKLKKIQWNKEYVFINWSDYFDYFMYIEDDMLVSWNTIKYWLKYKDKLVDILFFVIFYIREC